MFMFSTSWNETGNEQLYILQKNNQMHTPELNMCYRWNEKGKSKDSWKRNEDDDPTYQKSIGYSKVVLRQMFIVISAYIQK